MATNITLDQSEGGTLEPTGVSHHSHTHSHLFLTLEHTLVALWTWLANTTQIVNLLLDSKLRRQPRSAMIISISISDLLVAGFLCPLYTDSLVRGPWRHGLLVCSLYEVIFYIQVSVSSLAVLVLNIERFYFMLAPRLLQAPTKRHVTVLLTSLPWVVSLVVIIPLFMHGARASLDHVPGLHHRTCVVVWNETLQIVTIFGAFLAPSFLLLATSVAVLLIYVISTVRAAHDQRKGMGSPSTQAQTTTTSAETAIMGSVELAAAAADPQWSHSVSESMVMGGRGGQRLSAERRTRRRRHFSGLHELSSKVKKECVAAVCVSSFLTVALQFPLFTLMLLQKSCEHARNLQPHSSSFSPVGADGVVLAESPLHAMSGSNERANDCQFSDTAWAACMTLGMAKPGLLPLVWLFYSDVRMGLSLKACVRMWKCHNTSSPSTYASPSATVGGSTPSALQGDGGFGAECNSVPSVASQVTLM